MPDSGSNNRLSPYGELKYIKYDYNPTGQSNDVKKSKRVLDFLKTFPLAIAGVGLTVYAVGNGIRHFVRGNDMQQGRMMKLRVGAQGLALVCIIAQVYMWKPGQLKDFFAQDSPNYFEFDDDD